MKGVIAAIAIGLLMITGCTDRRGEVMIRIHNVSAFDYTEVFVNSPGGQHVYGDLSAGETSEYREYVYSYSYAFIQLKIDEEIFTIQPIDYVGETKIPGGNYTFEVDANENGGQYDRLSLRLVED